MCRLWPAEGLLAYSLPERLHGRQTRVIQADFTRGMEIYADIEAGLQDLDIGVLGAQPGRLALPCLLPCRRPPALSADPSVLSPPSEQRGHGLCRQQAEEASGVQGPWTSK